MINNIREFSFEDVQKAYKEYLKKQNLSQNTQLTSTSNAFYIWKKKDAETFWQVLFSDNFEELGKEILFDLLKQYSKGNVEVNVKRYMTHLRRFRQFLKCTTNINITKNNQNLKLSKKQKQRISSELPKPSEKEVEYYLHQWDSLEDYHNQEDALDRLFFTLCPENTNILDILLKVSTLNDFYSTNIFKVYPIAKYIYNLHIDERLQNGDVTLVDDIKNIIINNKTHNFYSFATKYCSHHKPLDYPIYDKYVDKVLRYYQRIDGFASFEKDDLKNYSLFKTILIEFRTFYNLEKYTLKELDRYLWLLGKKHFNSPSNKN